MAFAPWNVLAAGKIRTDAEEKKRLESGEGGRAVFGDWKRTESERKVCLALEKVAAEVGAKSITSGSPIHDILSRNSPNSTCSDSRNRVGHAEDALRLPHHWRA